MSGSNSLEEGESLRRVHSTGDITTNRRQQSRIGTLNTADNLPPILPALVPSSPSRTSTGSRVDTVPTIGFLQDIAPTVPTISEDFDIRSPRETSTGHRSSTQRRSGRITPTSLFKSVYTFLGYGPNNRARKELVSLIRSGIWSLLQVGFICTFVAYSAVHNSPTSAPFTEWRACDRPLGAWNCIWLFRVIFGFCMSVWGWRRERKSRSLESSRSRSSTIIDVESGRRTHNSARSPPSTRRARTATASELSNANQNSTVSKSTRMYNRLTLLLSLLTMTWFLIAHIFIYTSIQTCRFSSPHLWWLSFGIVSILYLMVLEVICIALVVFIVCPIAFLLWNILLLILGRHPLQHSHYAKPEGKISKAVVERLPLVLYIPPPPEETEKATVSFPVPVYNPKSGLTYPPATPAPNKRRHIFKFIRTKRSKRRTEAKAEDTTDVKVQSSDAKKNFGSWEDNWEASEYPFVRLEGNRATCAICLMDFEEPKKSSKYTDISSSPEEVSHVRATEQDNNAIVVSTIDESNDESGLHLEDAGEGAQPLRLLPCGHVFHKTCVDPWLLDVSGRCPTCQQAVEPKANKKAKRRRSR